MAKKNVDEERKDKVDDKTTHYFQGFKSLFDKRNRFLFWIHLCVYLSYFRLTLSFSCESSRKWHQCRIQMTSRLNKSSRNNSLKQSNYILPIALCVFFYICLWGIRFLIPVIFVVIPVANVSLMKITISSVFGHGSVLLALHYQAHVPRLRKV